MGKGLNHVDNRFQNYCYEPTIQLETNMLVLHAFLQKCQLFVLC